MTEDLISEEQAAALLDVPVDYLRTLRADQAGPPYYRGMMRKIRYSRAELEAWAESVDTYVRVEPGETNGQAQIPELADGIGLKPQPRVSPPLDLYAKMPEPARQEPARPVDPSVVRFCKIPEDWRPKQVDVLTSPEELEAIQRQQRPDDGIMVILASQGRLNPDGTVAPPRGGNWDVPTNDAAISLQREKGLKTAGVGLSMGSWADDIAEQDDDVAMQVIEAAKTGTQRVMPDGAYAKASVFAEMAGKPDSKILVVKR